MTRFGLILPFGLAVLIITGRALSVPQGWRMPRPYEYGSAAVIYAGAGLVGEASPGLGTAIAWGYLVALVLNPNSAHLLSMLAGGLHAPPGTSAQGVTPGQPTQPGGVAQPAQ